MSIATPPELVGLHLPRCPTCGQHTNRWPGCLATRAPAASLEDTIEQALRAEFAYIDIDRHEPTHNTQWQHLASTAAKAARTHKSEKDQQ